MTLGRPIVFVVYAEVTAPVVRSQTMPLLHALREAGEQVDAAALTSPRRLVIPSAWATHHEALGALEAAAGRKPIRLTHAPRDRGIERSGRALARELRRRGEENGVALCRQPRAAMVGIEARRALARRGGDLKVVLDLRGIRDVEYLLTLDRDEGRLSPDEKARGVRFWGFDGPLGAWICIWGSFAMIVSGPFDDWWHNAYGLDVEILSPPHTLLATGIIAIQIGAMLIVLARQNGGGREARTLQLLFGYAAGALVLMVAVMATEYIGFPNHWHSPDFYAVSAGIFPIFLVAASRASMMRWGATLAAGAYMGVTMLMIWILQLFTATPMLGPIYNPVDHMVPSGFPVVLVLPAAAIDLIMQRLGGDPAPSKQWRATLGLGVAFLSVLIIVHWFFAEFLLSPAARNFVFGADQWDYNSRLGDWRYDYWGTTASVGPLIVALFIAMVSTRLGLWWGNWMVRVRR